MAAVMIMLVMMLMIMLVMMLMIMPVVISIAVIAVIAVVTMIAVIAMIIVIAAIRVLASVARDVFFVVPIVAHEIDRPAARVVLRAMLAPVLLVPRRDVQVDRLDSHVLRGPHCYDRLRIYDGRPGDVADIDLPKESGFTQRNRHADIACKCGRCQCRQQCCTHELIHSYLPRESAVAAMAAVTQTAVLSHWTVASGSCMAPERGNTFQRCGGVA